MPPYITNMLEKPSSRRSRLLMALLASGLALAPLTLSTDAEARPGRSGSIGSRGSRTDAAPPPTTTAPGTAQSFQRTEGSRIGTASTVRPTNSRFGSGLMGGLMGGLLGAGLLGLLFGGGLFGGLSGLASMVGLLVQVALVAMIGLWAWRWFQRRSRPALAGMPQGMSRSPAQMMGGGTRSAPLQITDQDFQAFEQTLYDVHTAWGNNDTIRLSRLCTPEMSHYFAEDLRAMDTKGWRNEIKDVRFESGDLSEAWQEHGQDYATVAMRFSLIDTTYNQHGQVVEGDPVARQVATELWTFVRQPGRAWALSAIQQTQ